MSLAYYLIKKNLFFYLFSLLWTTSWSFSVPSISISSSFSFTISLTITIPFSRSTSSSAFFVVIHFLNIFIIIVINVNYRSNFSASSFYLLINYIKTEKKQSIVLDVWKNEVMFVINKQFSSKQLLKYSLHLFIQKKNFRIYRNLHSTWWI